VAGVGVDELGAAQVDGEVVGDVEAEDGLDLGALLQPARQPPAQLAGCAGDEDPLAYG
jgi:hypothetical protein